MNRSVTQRRFRLFLLRVSSTHLAVIFLLALAMALAGFWLEEGEFAWLILLTTLLALCVLFVLLRLGPVMWRDLSRYRHLHRIGRVQSMRHHHVWRCKQAPARLVAEASQQLAGQHYAVYEQKQDGVTVLSAMRGRLNRLGFILTHGAVLLILIGALLDSGLATRWQLNSGRLHATSAVMPLNEMPAASRIGRHSSLAFEGYESLRSGQITDEVGIETPQGRLVKHLPFAVAVQGVELDNRHTLLEDNFLTRISILDPKLDEPVRAVLGANRPFHYRGLDYHQAAVVDGGSELTVSMWPMFHARPLPLQFHTLVGAGRELQTRQGTIHIKFADLKPRNILLLQADVAARPEYKNTGPSLFYTVNDEEGRERQYINYMLPVVQEGRYFLISGYRPHSDGPFKYMHIPVDRDGKLNRFIELHAALQDPPRVDAAIDRVLADAGKAAQNRERDEFRATLVELADLFRRGGLEAVNKNIVSRVDSQNRQQSLRLSYKLVRSVVYALYKEGLGLANLDEFDLLFFEDALPALGKVAQADMPIYIQLEDMLYKPAVRLQVSYKPGASLFLGGWLMLLIGLVLSFLLDHRRVWLVFQADGEYTTVSMAGMAGRQPFAREFKRLSEQLQEGLNTC